MSGLIDLGVPPRFELRLATLVSRVGVPTAMLKRKDHCRALQHVQRIDIYSENSLDLVFRASKTDSSLQGATPTMIEPPSTPAFFPSALVA